MQLYRSQDETNTTKLYILWNILYVGSQNHSCILCNRQKTPSWINPENLSVHNP